MRFLRHLTVRKVEVGLGALFLLLTVPLVLESIDLGPGWGESGPEPGLFPLLMTAIVVLGALGVIGQAVRERSTPPFFEEKQEVVDLVKVGVPLVVATALVPYLGLYLMSILYIWFFGLWYGRHRWYIVVPVGLALAFGIYWTLEKTFDMTMPKSLWYPTIPF